MLNGRGRICVCGSRIVGHPTLPQKLETPQPEVSSLNDVGRANEEVTDRLELLGERLRDLSSLEGALQQISVPVREVLSRNSKIEMRVLELDALLSRERDSSASLRDLHAATNLRLSALSQDFTAQRAELNTLQLQAKARLDELNHLTRVHEEISNQSTLWERDARVEGQRASRLEAEINHFRAAHGELETRLVAKTREHDALNEAHDQVAAERRELEHRLQTEVAAVADLNRELSQRDLDVQSEREALKLSRLALEAEVAARARAEDSLLNERSASQAIVAALTGKLESALSRHASVEKALVQTKSVLDDKTNLLATAEKDARGARADMTLLQARHDTIHDELTRSNARYADLRRVQAQTREQLAVSQSLLSTKEALLHGAEAKVASLSARISDIVSLHEQERSALAKDADRVLDELHKERAERTMAQGALDIARASRTSLLQQLSSVKRKPTPMEKQDIEDSDSEVRKLGSPKSGESNIAFLHNVNAKE